MGVELDRTSQEVNDSEKTKRRIIKKRKKIQQSRSSERLYAQDVGSGSLGVDSLSGAKEELVMK